jgi:hypothetical protein
MRWLIAMPQSASIQENAAYYRIRGNLLNMLADPGRRDATANLVGSPRREGTLLAP